MRTKVMAQAVYKGVSTTSECTARKLQFSVIANKSNECDVTSGFEYGTMNGLLLHMIEVCSESMRESGIYQTKKRSVMV